MKREMTAEQCAEKGRQLREGRERKAGLKALGESAHALHETIIDDAALERQNKELRDLIKWLAPRIERIPGSGIGVSQTMCLLCVLGKPEFKRLPCRHGEIWKIARET
jgi:hypothetical protein